MAPLRYARTFRVDDDPLGEVAQTRLTIPFSRAWRACPMNLLCEDELRCQSKCRHLARVANGSAASGGTGTVVRSDLEQTLDATERRRRQPDRVSGRVQQDNLAAEMKLNPIRVADNIRHLGVIGDVHARVELLEGAADALRAAGADAIVCVGDIYGPGNGTGGCCRVLHERQILTVRGNHDRWFLEAADCDDGLRASVSLEVVEFLSALPTTLSINSVAGPVLVCHGVGTNDLAHVPQTFPHSFVRRAIRVGLIPPRCKLVVHGHSHLQREPATHPMLQSPTLTYHI